MLRSSHTFKDEEEDDNQIVEFNKDHHMQEEEEACGDFGIVHRIGNEWKRFASRLTNIDKESMKAISLLALVIFVILRMCSAARDTIVEPKSIAKLQEHSGVKIEMANGTQRSIRRYGLGKNRSTNFCRISHQLFFHKVSRRKARYLFESNTVWKHNYNYGLS
jgi:hypothetical protein